MFENAPAFVFWVGWLLGGGVSVAVVSVISPTLVRYVVLAPPEPIRHLWRVILRRDEYVGRFRLERAGA